MTLPIFIGLLFALGILVSLLTEVVKKMLDDANRKYSSNFLVLLIAVVIGIGGTAVFYALTGIPFTAVNVMCMILMGFSVWLSAMQGYDKVVQLIKQFASLGLFFVVMSIMFL